jgi:short subunit dehydrogenase-like uncharacterized protein
MTTARDFDLVIFGATGFTGRLVAEHIARSPHDKPRWAIAGRNRDKLASLGFDVPILVGDSNDRPSLDAIARQTKVVCTTAGPYAKYGSHLLAACVDAGTHYCDLTGEIQWLRRMIDAHHDRATQTGARIVNSCGFDSIPSDLGTWALQQDFISRFGRPASSVTALFGETSGGLSGGTVASGMQTAKEASEDRTVRRLLANPYGLDPDGGDQRPRVPDESSIGYERRLGMFTVPFVMAPYNTRIVRRGHALANFPYGTDFTYREVMSTPGSARGALMAAGFLGGLAGIAFAMKRPRLRALLASRAPQPGEGPSEQTRTKGHWKTRFIGQHGDDQLIYVASDRADPGYGSTAKMLGESALCLALDPLTSPGGLITPALAMGPHLLSRLRRAGLTFGPAN